MELKIRDRIARPASEVFETIISDEGLSRFFTAKGSAPLVEGTTVTWYFGHVDTEMRVEVKKIVPNSLISWTWPAVVGGTTVAIALHSEGPDATLLEITESGLPENTEGAAMAVGQTQGWTYFISGLRAYLLHGIEHFGLSNKSTRQCSRSPAAGSLPHPSPEHSRCHECRVRSRGRVRLASCGR
jgi:uncharacterized protein YndB with AHSA1/START domain